MLVPRGGAWAERVGREARARLLEPVVVPLITDVDPEDPGPFVRATAALRAGAYAWLAVTSATAVRRVADRVPVLPVGTRVAAVGAATAAACTAVGWPVDLVPASASAADLAAAFPATDGAVLVPASEIAEADLVTGLRDRGVDVHDVEAYRTVGTGSEPVLLDPPPDAVLVTSGSVATQVALRMTPLDPRTHVVCIGPGTARSAAAVGLPVHAVAADRSSAAMLDAVVALLAPSPDTRPGR